MGACLCETSDDQFNILVMDGFRRRAKLLIALNRGAYVVNSKWVKDSLKNNAIQAPEEYIIKVDKKD